MHRRIIFIFAFLFGASGLAHAQLTWTEIATPGAVSQFALGSDGSLYILSGGNLFFSGDDGAQWTQIYSAALLACDSTGGVIILNDSLRYSSDHGATWNSSSVPVPIYESAYLQATGHALYFVGGGGIESLWRSMNSGRNWSEIASLGSEFFDCAGLCCGPSDRIYATLSFESYWLLFQDGQQLHDTSASLRFAIADNSPPRNILFARDGYIYAFYLEFLIRLPANTLTWEVYDSLFDQEVDTTQHIPLGSPNATTILSLDSFSTYASYNHGDSWSIIGSGISTDYAPSVVIAFGPDGKGYAVANGILYETKFFQSSVTSPPPQPPIALYPVPCKSLITIHASDIERVEIIDLLGVTRIDREFQQASEPQLDVSGLAPGVYSVVVAAGGKSQLVRMVKE